jgi:hypothetical protein
VVSDDGSFAAPKVGSDGRSQAELLKDEGLIVSSKKITISFEKYFLAVEKLKSDVKKQQRPAEYQKPMNK